MGIMFVIFACLFIITYVIFNHYINIDQIKLPSLDTLSSLTGSEGATSKESAQLNQNGTTPDAFADHWGAKKEPSFFNFISSSNT